MPSAEPLRVWRGGGGDGGLGRVHPLQQDFGLPGEQRQHLALEAALAERHARQMIEIDRRIAGRERRRRHFLECERGHVSLPGAFTLLRDFDLETAKSR